MFGLAIHGGAGSLPRGEMGRDDELKYRAGLSEALDAGFAVLQAGGASLEAVARAVVVLEDNPLFNAGRGAVFTLDGRNELDAAIMDGGNLRAGAVCGLTRIKNPIELARSVMEHSDYVMLSGSGAEEFASSRGFEFVPPSYFYTPARWRQLERIRRGDAGLSPLTISHVGTVGAVALDSHGRLGRGDVHGGNDRQALRPDRRLAHHRRRHLRRRSLMCGIGHRTRRNFHSRRSGPRHLLEDAFRRPLTPRRGARSRSR